MHHPIIKVEPILRSTKGIVDVKWLNEETRAKILEIENSINKEGLSMSGEYYNEGAIKVLTRRFVGVLLNNNEFRHATEPSLFWVAGDIVIGEEIMDPRRLQTLIKQDNIKVLKKDFVLYFDRIKKARGQVPVFVIRGISFPEIEDIKGIQNVLSASPAGSVDAYLKERFGWDTKARDLGTILIGFNPL